MDQIEQLKQVMAKIVEDDDFFKLKAKMSKKMYDALIKEGFSESQAVEIIANQGQQ